MDRYFQSILDQYQNLTESATYMVRLWSFFDDFQPLHRLRNGEAIRIKKGNIRFDHCSFRYPGTDSDAITDVTLEFVGGKKTALVGRSGAGKSTIVKMLLGLFLPNAGKIEIDGKDLSEIRLDSYFPHVGYLPQEPSVFDGTIRENLVIGMDPHPSDEAIFRALDHAKCDFIHRLPE